MILDNFRFLNRCTSADGPALLPRVPLIPGITDTSENLHRIAEFLSMDGKENPGVPRILYTQPAVSFWLDAEGLAIAA
jgi:pyruvate-formate lyase-activating enzyme